jgi:hypothetical protein
LFDGGSESPNRPAEGRPIGHPAEDERGAMRAETRRDEV